MEQIQLFVMQEGKDYMSNLLEFVYKKTTTECLWLIEENPFHA